MKLYLIPLILGIIFEAIFIVFEYRKKPETALILKSCASFMFIVLGIICYLQTSNIIFGIMILIGLVFGALGDVCLNLRNVLEKQKDRIFIMGIAAFLLGHLFYIATLIICDAKALYIAIPMAAVLSAIILYFTLKNIDVPKKLKIFGPIYIAIVIIMFSCATSLLILYPTNKAYLIFTAGAFLFMLSDIVLVFNLFGNKKVKALRAINLSTYYIGQLLIAISIILV